VRKKESKQERNCKGEFFSACGHQSQKWTEWHTEQWGAKFCSKVEQRKVHYVCGL
jgi:hypothetical protein